MPQLFYPKNPIPEPYRRVFDLKIKKIYIIDLITHICDLRICVAVGNGGIWQAMYLSSNIR